ncbi:MAG TPA: tetratricopeptide repeat protein [Nostocaceae cyanobacterium]|nr:tetratricopeptide repeat protein [Nostocaceae cyanobacterium]
MNIEFYHQGLEKAQQKDYTGAIQDFTQALQADPYFVSAYIKRGLAYYDSGATLQAVSDYTQALKLDDQNPEAYYCRALARLTLKNLPGSLEDVEKAIHLNRNYAAAYDLRGMIKRKEGFIQEAIANFKKAAELYLEQKDAANCRFCLDKIKQIQPKEPPKPQPTVYPKQPILTTSDYFLQLLNKAEQGNIQEAMADINWILQTDSQDAKAYCCRGVVRYKMGDYREAIADFNQALQLNFQDPIVYRNRGKARFQLGDHQGALSDFSQVVKMQPEDALVYTARGNVHRAMGNYLGAIKDYNQALQINTNDAQAYYNRGITYALLEEMRQAIADYQTAASIYCEKEDWDNYQLVIDSLQKIQSSSPEINYQKEQFLRQKLLRLVGGQWEIAQRLIQNQREKFPGMSEDWYIERAIYQLERDRNV